MRRVLTFVMALLLASSTFLGGCGGKGAQKKAQPDKPVNPFTLDYELTDESIAFFTQGETVEMAAIRQPLDSGLHALPGQNTQEFEKLRAAKVKQVRKDAKALVAACEKAQPSLASMRSGFTEFLDLCVEKEPGLKTFATSAMEHVALGGTRELLGIASYQSFSATSTGDDPYAKSFMQYLEIQQAVDLGGRHLQDGNDIATLGALLSEAAKSSKNSELVDAAKAFDKRMAGDYKAAAKALDGVTKKLATVDLGMRQLESADYLLSSEAMSWMKDEMVDLEKVVAELEPRDGLTEQDVLDIQTWFVEFKIWNDALAAQLEALDTGELVMVDPAEPGESLIAFGPEKAFAATDEYVPGQDYASATAVLSAPPGVTPAKLPSAWDTFTSGVSSAFGKLKTGAGVTLDTLDAGVANIERLGAGWYYGNDWKDIVDDMRRNSDQIGKNYQAGMSGSSVLKTANGYLEGVETGAGDAAGGAVTWGIEKTIGKGTVSDWAGWATNGLVKITTGMFTGLGKGIYKIADKGSSSADVATGIVEVGLSCIGGSKIFIKGSQIPGLLKGLGQGSKEGAKAVLNLVKTMGAQLDKKALSKEMAELLANNKLTQAQVQQLISNSIKLEAKQAFEQALRANRAAMVAKVRELLAAGKAASLTNFKETVKGSLEDLLSKSFNKSLQGWLDAGTTVIGANMKDYFDNLVGSQLDPYLTKIITAALAIPPDAVQLNGNWTGTMTVTKLETGDDGSTTGAQENAAEEGCDIDLNQLKGKPIPLSISLNLSAGGSGSVTMVINEQAMPGQATYSDGTIKINVSGKKITYVFSGAATFTETGLRMSGSFVAPGIFTGVWSAAK